MVHSIEFSQRGSNVEHIVETGMSADVCVCQ